MSLTADQQAQRRGKVTASVMADIAGVSDWRGPLAAWLRITGRHREDPIKQSDPRAWGHDVETLTLGWYAKTRGIEIAHWGTLVHPSLPWLLATPDACVFGERTVVEAKNVGRRMAHHWDDGPPEYVRVQAYTQMEVCDADHCDIVAAIGGEAPQMWRLDRDREIGAALIGIAKDFYFGHVVTDDPPPIDEKTTAKDIEEVFPKHSEDIVTVDEDADLVELIEEYRLAGAIASACSDLRDDLKTRLVARIADRKGLLITDTEGRRVRCTWSLREASDVSYKREAYRHLDVREVKEKATKARASKAA
jgi:putative phage-type endonuclease